MKFLVLASFILCTSFANANLLKVSSILSDFGTLKSVKVTGVGSVVKMENRFFVLTAGHVTFGEDLQVQGPAGEKIPIRDRFDDFENDITLLEVDSSYQPIWDHLIAAYGRHPDLPTRAIVTDLAPSFSSEESGVMIRPSTSKRYQTRPIDFGLPNLGSPRAKYRSHSIVIMAPWLRQLTWLELEQYLQPTNSQNLSDSSETVSHKLNIPFPSGYSGSPLLVHQGTSMYSLSSIYTISGILTASGSIQSETQSDAAGPGPLNLLFESAYAGQRETKSRPVWFLINGIFARLNQQFDLFVFKGPIGNGVAVDGRIAEEKQTSFGQRLLDQRLKEKNLSELEIENVKSGIRRFGGRLETIRELNVEGRRNAIEKEIQQINSPTLKIRIR